MWIASPTVEKQTELLFLSEIRLDSFELNINTSIPSIDSFKNKILFPCDAFRYADVFMQRLEGVNWSMQRKGQHNRHKMEEQHVFYSIYIK